MNSETQFTERKKKFSLEAERATRKYNLYSTLRVLLFLIGLTLFVYFVSTNNGVGIFFLIIGFTGIFGMLVNKHSKIKAGRDTLRHLAQINEQELLRLAGNLHTLASGEQFSDTLHPYLRDMDVFGRNSLYQLLNRTNTPSGRKQLADWLKYKSEKEEIEARQQAVTELRENIDWRQHFQAAGMSEQKKQQNFETIIDWINAPNVVQHARWTRLFAYLLPTLIIASIALNIFMGLSIYVTLGLALVSGVVLKQYAFYVTDITENTNQGLQTLKAYAALIKIIENSSFQSSYLRNCQKVFIHNGLHASRSIAQLQRILEFLNGRANWFYLFFNLALLFDIHLLLKIEKWKQNQRGDVKLWFERIAGFEAVNSLAGFAFANADCAMPKLTEDPFTLQATALGHPLISKDERVRNDFNMQARGSITLITGSNMSGKSTFLRTIGVNMILAYAGAPVCAEKMSISSMQLFTSMRTEDNLEEHISSFYAELKRIQQLLELIAKGEPVLFMLDEILKGTNSQDRHAGAEALIRQLADENAMGFVSTHDLALGKLADDMPNIQNYSFNSEVKDDKIIFNYKLTEGLCRSFNASKLMEQIGIKMKKGK